MNDWANSASMAFLPFALRLRVPVPVKCGCAIRGTAEANRWRLERE